MFHVFFFRFLNVLLVKTSVYYECKTQIWRIRFIEAESGFGLDSVKPSIQCVNPKPDSQLQF